MKTLVLAAPGHESLGEGLAREIGGLAGELEFRRFPDGEAYVRIATPIKDANVVVAASLKDPDPQVPTILFIADAARELGARRVGLAVPYLAYMRQDTRFRDGEAITSRTFARTLSNAFDWLVTVDPHLHRYRSLDEIYSIPTAVAKAAPALASWIRANVERPIVIGPDSESAQWAAEVAAGAEAPYAVLEKERRGDRDVKIAGKTGELAGHTPVLIDDIISSARTMAEAVHLVRAAGGEPPVCIGIHALFADGAVDLVHSAGASRLVTCNTVRHPSNTIDVLPYVARAVESLLP